MNARHGRSAGLPVMVLGTGPPVVHLPGLSFSHAPPKGASLLWERALLHRLSRHMELHWVGRRSAVPVGYTMEEFPEDYANVLAARFSHPVPVLGFSRGGFLVMQLAADHPALVELLVVAGAGHTLSETGRAANRRWIEALTGGRPGDAWRELAVDLIGTQLIRALAGHVLASVGPLVTPSLSKIAAPTLIVAGDRDTTCPADILHRTARGIDGAQL